jgi:hypothetical protein
MYVTQVSEGLCCSTRSTQLSAYKLRSELIVMRPNSIWRKIFESFDNFWTQELEAIEGKAINDDMKNT